MIMPLSPSHDPKELCNFSQLGTQSATQSSSSLKPSPDAEIFPVFIISCTILARYFLMAQFKCPRLGLATTPSRPNPSLAG